MLCEEIMNGCAFTLTDLSLPSQLPSSQLLGHVACFSFVPLSPCLIKYRVLKTYGVVKILLHTFVASVLDGGKWSDSRCYQESRPLYPWIGNFRFPEPTWTLMEKQKVSYPKRESTPSSSVVQLVTSHNTRDLPKLVFRLDLYAVICFGIVSSSCLGNVFMKAHAVA
jgi:hypothetical protein